MTKGHFEARKWSYRQTKEGIVISLLVHPNDLDAALAIAPLGTIYMIGFAEVEPKGEAPNREDGEGQRPEPPTRSTSPVSKPKERKKWREMPPSQRAALLTKDVEFHDYMVRVGYSLYADEAHANEALKRYCRVTSKADIHEGDKSNDYLMNITADFRAWQQARQLGAA